MTGPLHEGQRSTDPLHLLPQLSAPMPRAPLWKRVRRIAFFGAALGAIYLGQPAEAFAASPQDRAAADALFDSGVKLMEAGNFDKACPKFQKSYDLDPGVGTLLNLGRCYDLAGKHASAWSTYREASAMARQEGQSAREEHAREEARKLEPKLVRVRIQLAEGLADLPGFKLTQDGVDLVADAVVGEAIPVDPGLHQIMAVADGYEPRTVEVTATEEGKTYPVLVAPLEPGETAPAPVVAAEVPPEPAPKEEAPVEATAPPPEEKKGRSLAGPIILGTVGLALAGTGTAFAFMAKGHDNEARSICEDDDDPCSDDDADEHAEVLSKAKSNATIAYIGWGVGGAAITGAVIWLVAGGSSNEKENVGKMRLTPVVGGDVWGLSARGTF